MDVDLSTPVPDDRCDPTAKQVSPPDLASGGPGKHLVVLVDKIHDLLGFGQPGLTSSPASQEVLLLPLWVRERDSPMMPSIELRCGVQWTLLSSMKWRPVLTAVSIASGDKPAM